MKSEVTVRMRTCFFHNVLFWIKSLHIDLLLSTGYLSVRDPALCLPSEQQSEILKTLVSSGLLCRLIW